MLGFSSRFAAAGSRTHHVRYFSRYFLKGCALALALLLSSEAALAATVDKNAIIDQSETFYNGITADQLQTYLTASGSALANYTIPQNYDVSYPTGKGQWDTISVPQEWQPANGAPKEVYWGKTVAQLIYEWSTIPAEPGRNPSTLPAINPLIALATLEKESLSVIGSYRAEITTTHPITLSWLAGFGYDEGIAACTTGGSCDLAHNQQIAQYYGGPGQQIAEMIWFMRKQAANPTAYGSSFCDTTNWRTIKIDGECLSLQNSISYALYRYTPHTQQLFFNLYNTIKTQFSVNVPIGPPTDETANDISVYTDESYVDSVNLVGNKSPSVQAWFRNKVIAGFNTNSWQLTFQPSIGSGEDAIEYRRANGSVVNRKSIKITRHKLGDVNGDGKVDILDLSMIATSFSKTDPENALVNLNPSADTQVDLLDLSILSSHWSP